MKKHQSVITSAAMSLVLAAGSITLVGCGREDPDVSAVKTAAIHLEAAPGSSTKAYGKVVSDLGTVGKQSGKTAAAAAALIATSQNGLGDAESAEYLTKEREAGEKGARVRVLLNAYINRHSVAAAAESFDPAQELTRIAEAITQNEGKRAAVDAESKALEKQVGDLRAQAQDLLTQANGKQEQYARMSTSMARMGAVEAANAAEQAHAIKREGDRLRQQGNELAAQADSMTPLVEQKSLEVAMYDAQIQNLRTTTEELRARAELSRTAASETRATADKDASEIDALVRDIDALRAGDVKTAAEKALRTLKSAEASAKSASREAKEQSDILVAAAQQSIGDVHWSRAVGASQHAALLEALAKARPAFARSTEYLSRSQAERKEEEESKKAAAEAYDAAKNALERAPARGAAKERLQAIAAEIGKRAAMARGEAVDSAAANSANATAPNASANPGTDPAPSAANGAMDPGLQTLLTTYCAAVREGRYKDVAALVHTSSDDIRGVVDAIMEMTGKAVALDEAMRAKFNTSLQDAMSKLPGAEMMMQGAGGGDPAKLKVLQVSDLTVKSTSDSATIQVPSNPRTLQAKKIDSEWKLVIPELAMLGPQAAMLGKVLPSVGAAFDEITSGINSGAITSADAAMQTFMQKMMAMQGAMGGAAGPK